MKTRAIAIPLLIALGVFSLASTAPAAAAGGRLEVAADPAAQVLSVVVAETADGLVFEVSGPGAHEYQLWLEPNGSLRLQFPGSTLVVDEEVEHVPFEIPPADPGTLVVPLDGWRIRSVLAADGNVRIALAGVSMPAGDGYTIGVGDKLRVTIHGDEDLGEQEVRVVGEGTISVPYLGDVTVGGLTEAEAAAEVTRRLAAGFLRDPKLSLEVIEYRSQWVNVFGEVVKPGKHFLKGRMTLVDILAEAGGLKKEAGSEIRIVRAAYSGQPGQALVIRRDSLYLTDDRVANPVLHSGDSVTVSGEQYFFIKGEVKTPGRYTVEDGTTILKAISLAGGFAEFANQKKVELLRQENSETIRLVINIGKIENQKADDVRILPGDIINVKARFL